MKNNDPKARECGLFMCDKTHGAYCCRKCRNFNKCKNPCINTPTACGYYKKGGVEE